MSTILRSEPLAPECGVTVHDVQLAEAEELEVKSLILESQKQNYLIKIQK